MQFATPVYDFGKARCGEPVKYTYYFTNVGDAVLELSNVQPQCGCTTAGEFTRKVDPGQMGTIPIQFNTAAYNGQVFKTVTVTSNDKKQPTYVLQFKGVVWKPIEIIPPYPVLNLAADSASGSMTVHITNHLDTPLELYDLHNNAQNIKAELKTNEIGKNFEVTLTTVPPLSAGNTAGKFSLKTSETNMPTLDVQYWVNVPPGVTVMPPQIYLGQAPMLNASTNAVNIQNNGATPMTLSDASVDIPGVDVEIRELKAGHTFSVVFGFPAGFVLPLGMQQGSCTVRSSHPQFPLIKIPIMQAPRPAMPPIPNSQSAHAPGAQASVPSRITAPAPAIK
jgi:hypothetical protein